jgi:hypothetical protein
MDGGFSFDGDRPVFQDFTWLAFEMFANGLARRKIKPRS